MDVRSIPHLQTYGPTGLTIKGLLLIVTLVCLVRPVGGQEAKSQWWNPTTWSSGDKTVRKSSFFSGSSQKATNDKPLLSMPHMPWSSSEKPATEKPPATSSGPSAFSKMGKSTKRAWNNTVDFLNPFDNEAAQPQQQGYQPQTTTTKPGTGIFGWMWREETTETPASVNEFLRQERPRF